MSYKMLGATGASYRRAPAAVVAAADARSSSLVENGRRCGGRAAAALVFVVPRRCPYSAARRSLTLAMMPRGWPSPSRQMSTHVVGNPLSEFEHLESRSSADDGDTSSRSAQSSIILRPRQELFVDRSLAALHEHKNTLGVAPTGFGKTIVLSAVVKKFLEMNEEAKVVCIIAHRDEILEQNRVKFGSVAPGISSSVFDAKTKSWDGPVIFAMVQTLAKRKNLDAMPRVDLLVIDEAHHAASKNYLDIIGRVLRANPECLILGLTATPHRGDGRGLRDIFDNFGDQVCREELIKSGHLVRPRLFVIDTGVNEKLLSLRKVDGDYNIYEVDKIMNNTPVLDEVVRHWREKASDRPTVVFCSTVEHANNVEKGFLHAGISVGFISAKLNQGERRRILDDYTSGKIQVIVNVAVLCEGWDHPPTSCVVLLRPCSRYSVFTQMVGRGLRTVDPRQYPGVVKTDCIVLDFGCSSILHGTSERDVDLYGKIGTKTCPSCEVKIPLFATECPICREGFHRECAETTCNASDTDAKELLRDFEMLEISNDVAGGASLSAPTNVVDRERMRAIRPRASGGWVKKFRSVPTSPKEIRPQASKSLDRYRPFDL